MEKFLDSIESPDDLKKLKLKELKLLADEIREFLLENILNSGGHLASNLGVVELTIALHYIFEMPDDKIIWDVGHQSYVHKILTGRKNKFDTLRQLNGISGFPKYQESEYDSFNTGHSSTSISAALGMAKARDIKGEKNHIVAVIGDGALTGGMAYEALNDAGMSDNNIIIILNDNQMSISKNVGGMSKYLSKIRTQPIYTKTRRSFYSVIDKIPVAGERITVLLDRIKGSIKHMFLPKILFEDIGIKYIGPVNGHDIFQIASFLKRAKRAEGPVLVHVVTEKGKGYKPAETDPHKYHGISPVNADNQICKGRTFSSVFGRKITDIAVNETRIAAVCAAMEHGTCLDIFKKEIPERFFDVGIAEQHAVTFAAGLAKNGMIPVVALYSSFMQRAYDQILHDVALQGLKVIFAVDRAGITGRDGETHQGIYDLSYLLHMPDVTVMAPCCYQELEKMLEFAVYSCNGPVCIRYPKGREEGVLDINPDIEYQKSIIVNEGNDAAVICTGKHLFKCMNAVKKLEKEGLNVCLVNARFIKPFDKEMLERIRSNYKYVISIEDNTIFGGFGSVIASYFSSRQNSPLLNVMALPDMPIPHGSQEELYKKYGLDEEGIVNAVLKMVENGKKA